MLLHVWFITGCSTGFGNILAKTLLEKGYSVCATARKPEALREELNAYSADKCLVLPLDVTHVQQVHETVQACISHFGHLDVLVNNAGYGLIGAIEEVTDDEFRNVMETNVFGIFNVTRAVLPYMRKQKSGHIFNLSSIAGVSAAPGVGLYNTSKFAVEGMSEALYLELEPLGIKVTVIEPGGFRTDFAGRSITITDRIIEDYSVSAQKSREYIKNINGNQAGDPQKLVNIMIDLTTHPNPPLRLLLGKDALGRAELKLNKWHDMIEAWRQVTTSTDFDA